MIHETYLQEIKNRIDYFFLKTDGTHKYPTPQVAQICQMIIELNNSQKHIKKSEESNA